MGTLLEYDDRLACDRGGECCREAAGTRSDAYKIKLFVPVHWPHHPYGARILVFMSQTRENRITLRTMERGIPIDSCASPQASCATGRSLRPVVEEVARCFGHYRDRRGTGVDHRPGD